MLAVNAGALRRQSLRGPGALLLHAIGGVSACFGGVTVGPVPPVPVGVDPPVPVSPAVPDPLPAVPGPAPAVPVPAPAVPVPAPPFPEPLPALPGPPPLPVRAGPSPAQPDAVRIAARATRQGRSIRPPEVGLTGRRSVSQSSCDGRARQSSAATATAASARAPGTVSRRRPRARTPTGRR